MEDSFVDRDGFTKNPVEGYHSSRDSPVSDVGRNGEFSVSDALFITVDSLKSLYTFCS